MKYGISKYWMLVQKRFYQHDFLPPIINLSNRSFLIWGANTDVGKTLLASLLAMDNHNNEVGFRYIKPVQTGFPEASDSHMLAKITLGTSVYLSDHARQLYPDYKAPEILTSIECHTLFAWRSPVSPHLAVINEGRGVTDKELIKKLSDLINKKTSCKFTVIETAGGVSSPAPSGNLLCDVLRPLRLPCILVGDSKLGGISTTMSAYDSLLLRGYEVCAIVMFENPDTENANFIDQQTLKHQHWVGFQRPITLVIPQFPSDPDKDRRKLFEEWFDDCFEPVEALRQVLYNTAQYRFNRLAETRDIAYSQVWWPFTQHKTLDKSKISVIDSRHGQFLSIFKNDVTEDAITMPQKTDGTLTPMFDASASWWTQGFEGDAQLELSRSIAYACGRFGHVLFPENIHEPAMRLTQKLLETVGEKWARRVFYSDDGSTAVEVAIKMALRRYLKIFKGTVSDKDDLHILGFSNGYHGDTLGAMQAQSLNIFTKFQNPWYKEKCACLDVPQLLLKDGEWIIKFPGNWPSEIFKEIPGFDPDMKYQKYKIIEEKKMTNIYEEFIKSFIQHYEKQNSTEIKTYIGACIMEPVVQGAGGMVLVDPLFQKSIKKICDDLEIPLILDEVFSGFWRLGAMSGAKLLNIKPDISCYAKLLTGGMLTMSATLATDDVYEAFLSKHKVKALLHGHSYTANPITCVSAITAMNMFTSPRFNSNLISKRDIKNDEFNLPKTFNLMPGLRPQDLRLKNIWNKALINEISCNDKVEGIVAIGTLCAITIKCDDGKGGYASDVAKPIVEKLKMKRILCRPLGNVVYVMVTPNSSVHLCDWLLGEINNVLLDLNK